MSLVATCVDVAVVAGDLVSACASADLVWKEESAFWDPALSVADVSTLLEAIAFTLVLAFGFRFLFDVVSNKR